MFNNNKEKLATLEKRVKTLEFKHELKVITDKFKEENDFSLQKFTEIFKNYRIIEISEIFNFVLEKNDIPSRGREDYLGLFCWKKVICIWFNGKQIELSLDMKIRDLKEHLLIKTVGFTALMKSHKEEKAIYDEAFEKQKGTVIIPKNKKSKKKVKK